VPTAVSFLLRIALIIGAGFWAFAPAMHGDWLWDDDYLITQNALIHDPAGWWKIWLKPGLLIDFDPIKNSVTWIEWQLWQTNTLGYHVVNVALHVLSSLLIWRLLHLVGLRWAWLGGLIFAIHPLNVESVAWLSEIKNTLSLPPFLLAICAHLNYEQRGKSRDYYLALAFFLVAMLCKVTMLAFPLVILLIACWKRGRIAWRDLTAAAPFALISAVLGLITLRYMQVNPDSRDIPNVSHLAQLAAGGLATVFYISKTFLPIGLMPIYPRWPVDPPTLLQFLPYPVILGLLVVCWTRRDTWGRHALLGLGFFLIMLAPFVLYIPMRYTWAMDHLLYIPLIGLIGVTVAALEDLSEKLSRPMRPLLLGLIAGGVCFLGWQCHHYAAFFQSQETLWSYAVAQNDGAWIAHGNLGAALYAKGDYQAAIAEENKSLQLHPTPDAYNNIGLSLMALDRTAEGLAAFEASQQLNPGYARTYNYLGYALTAAGRQAEAEQQFRTALRLDPQDEYAARFLHQLETMENMPDH
jgi:tetratricopeptide (TPR) repeat protein